MEQQKHGPKSEPEPENSSSHWRPWQPPRRQTRWWVLWAVGMLVALGAPALLAVNFAAVNWEDLSRERIEQVALLVAIAVGVTALIVLLAIGGAALGWTGFSEKKLWDWLQLLSALAIPVVLATAGFWFTAQQEQRQQEIEGQRAQHELKIENQRAEAERELADQRAQDEALQAYLDQMSALLLEKDLSDDKVQTLMRARTLTMLARMDPSRKSQIIQFLVESNLVQSRLQEAPVISLQNAELSGTNLPDLADLSGANLKEADLSNANWPLADLSNANLSYADLSNANLSEANLEGALMLRTDLRRANLLRATVDDEVIRMVPDHLLQGATLSGGSMYSGEYATDTFEPALSFSASGDWRVVNLETADLLSIVYTGEGPQGDLFFANPLHVFASTDPSEEIRAPDNADEWTSWLQEHPNLNTSNRTPVSIGGVSGVQIDVTPSSTPEKRPQDDYYCREQPCVPLFRTSAVWIMSVSTRYRFVIVDVGDETAVIGISVDDTADKFDKFLPKAQQVLGTVEWSESA